MTGSSPPRPWSPPAGRRPLRRLLVYAMGLAFTAFAVFPFYWMFITTFKQNRDLYVGATDLSHNPWIFNAPPTLDHLTLLFEATPYLLWLRNTALVGMTVVAITLVVSVPAAYALARLIGPWGQRLGVGFFLTYLVPPALLFIPFARLVSELRLQDSLGALIVIYPTFTIPFSTWLLAGFFPSIPREIEEQAMIDGCSRLQAFARVVLPLSAPGLLTVVIFAFTMVMQEFVYALTFISSVGNMTVSLGVPITLVRGDVYYWGSLMAASLITSLPLALVYNAFLDRFIAGLTSGAIRG